MAGYRRPGEVVQRVPAILWFQSMVKAKVVVRQACESIGIAVPY